MAAVFLVLGDFVFFEAAAFLGDVFLVDLAAFGFFGEAAFFG